MCLVNCWTNSWPSPESITTLLHFLSFSFNREQTIPHRLQRARHVPFRGNSCSPGAFLHWPPNLLDIESPNIATPTTQPSCWYEVQPTDCSCWELSWKPSYPLSLSAMGQFQGTGFEMEIYMQVVYWGVLLGTTLVRQWEMKAWTHGWEM